MRTLSLSFTAGEMKSLSIPGRYFRILSSGLNSVDVEFFKNNSAVGEKATAVDAGYYGIPEHGFDRVDVTSSTTQTVKVALGSGAGGYDRTVGTVDVSSLPAITGSVGITNTGGAFTHSQASVTNANTNLAAANSSRRYLMIQNNSVAGVLRVRMDGGAASATFGLRLQPVTNAVYGFMETADATANNVEIIQG
jgi:hypothetical protein